MAVWGPCAASVEQGRDSEQKAESRYLQVHAALVRRPKEKTATDGGFFFYSGAAR